MPDARDYLRGKPRQGGAQIEDLEFTNEIGGETFYVMRKEGNPTGSEDTKAVINLGYALSNFYFSVTSSTLSLKPNDVQCLIKRLGFPILLHPFS